MNSSINMQFAWADFYSEFADKLLQFKNNRTELLSILEETYDELGLNYPFVEKSRERVKDVCPFSVFGCFNKGITNENRIMIMKTLGQKIGVQGVAPSEFAGVPVLNNMKAWFFSYEDERKSDDISNLWSMFEAALENADNPSEANEQNFVNIFNKVMKQRGIRWNLTMGLFWIRPYHYINLDEKNRIYLKDNETFSKIFFPDESALKQLPDAKTYLNLIQKCKAIFASAETTIHDFPELSRSAWLHSQQHPPVAIDVEQQESRIENDTIFQNTILYGPPGTGKTYSLTKYAVAIIENKKPEQIDEEIYTAGYQSVHKRFNDYRAKGLIEFTTFHQSYSYEDFIEGIRPSMNDDEINGSLRYDIIPGAFQKFCENAQQKVISSVGIKNLLNDNPTVWKVSLGGAGDNPIKKYCFDTHCIRIGWDDYPDYVEDIDSVKTDLSSKAITILFDFEQGMKKGDLAVSLYNQTTIDAVGIITGDYENDKSLAVYRRKRKVRWLFTGKTYDISKLNNNKVMTPSTVYRLHRIGSSDLLDSVKDLISKDLKVEDTSRNHVFIIDEINRGNISKIFGELITLIEPEKRLGGQEEMKVLLPYSQRPFGVPSNVYILGTMNTADRSIALMDTALRRRFRFIEMMPDLEVLRRLNDGEPLMIEDTDIDVLKMIAVMNKRIQLLYDREHTLGHAYFIELVRDNSVSNLASIFKNRILPLLQEYFFDDIRKILLVLGDNQTANKDWQFILANDPEPGLFGSNDDDIPEDLTFYKINDAAFMRPEAYIKIYTKL